MKCDIVCNTKSTETLPHNTMCLLKFSERTTICPGDFPTADRNANVLTLTLADTWKYCICQNVEKLCRVLLQTQEAPPSTRNKLHSVGRELSPASPRPLSRLHSKPANICQNLQAPVPSTYHIDDSSPTQTFRQHVGYEKFRIT